MCKCPNCQSSFPGCGRYIINCRNCNELCSIPASIAGCPPAAFCHKCMSKMPKCLKCGDFGLPPKTYQGQKCICPTCWNKEHALLIEKRCVFCGNSAPTHDDYGGKKFMCKQCLSVRSPSAFEKIQFDKPCSMCSHHICHLGELACWMCSGGIHPLDKDGHIFADYVAQ
jgi:hypothetical protein